LAEEKVNEIKDSVAEKLTEALPDAIIPHVKNNLICSLRFQIRDLKEEISREIHEELVRDGLEEETPSEKQKENFKRILEESGDAGLFAIDEDEVNLAVTTQF
jgi:hypothetical protein